MDKKIDKKIEENKTEILRKSKIRKNDDRNFNNTLESFDEWDRKRKDKLEKMKKDREINFLKELNKDHPKKVDIFLLIKRLYTDDIINRERNREILEKLYNPIYKILSKNESFRIIENYSNNSHKFNLEKSKTLTNFHTSKDEANNNTIDNHTNRKNIKRLGKKTTTAVHLKNKLLEKNKNEEKINEENEEKK